MKPVAEQRSLTVAWCVPVTDFEQWASTKPDVVWRLLLSTRVDGGLVKALRAEGLISGLDASVEELTRSFALLSVSFDLTALGLERWPEVRLRVSPNPNPNPDPNPNQYALLIAIVSGLVWGVFAFAVHFARKSVTTASIPGARHRSA